MLSRTQHAANVAANQYPTDRWGNRIAPEPVRAKGDNGNGAVSTGVRRRGASVSAEVFNDPVKMQAQNLRNLGRYAEAEKLDGQHVDLERLQRRTTSQPMKKRIPAGAENSSYWNR